MPDYLIPRILELGIAPVAFLLMLVVGLSLELPAVAASLKPIRRLVADLALTVVLPPVAAVITVLALRPSGETAAAILLLAACPVGDIANAYTLLARGSVARSLSLNALTAMLAPISMVAVFCGLPIAWSGPPFHRRTARGTRPETRGFPAAARFPWHEPFVTARLASPPGSFPPSPVSPRRRSCFCWPWFWQTRHRDRTTSPTRSAAPLSFSPFPPSSAWRFYRMLRRSPGEKTAILLCLPVRNVGIAALVAVSLLGETRMLGVTAVYFALEVAIFLPLAVWLGRRAKVTASS